VAYPIWLGEVAVSESLTCNTVALTISATSAYPYSATAGESLAALFAAQIQTVTNLSGFTVTFSHTTGKFTFSNPAPSSTTASISGISTTLQGYLGLTASTLSLAVGASSTGTNPSRICWLPAKYPSSRSAPTGEIGQYESDTVTGLNADGSSYSSAYEIGYRQRLGWSWLPVQKVFPTSGYTNEDVKGFWYSVMRLGKRVRYVEDPDSSTTPLATYYPLQETTGGHAFRLSDAPRLRYFEYEFALSTTSSGA
jgi:hypothetical protein